MEVACEKATLRKQPEIELAMTSWIIDDCQPLYILRFQSFKMFMKVACLGFNVPHQEFK